MALLLLMILIVLLIGGAATWRHGRSWGRAPDKLRRQCRCGTSRDNDLGVDSGRVSADRRHSETAETPTNVENVRTILRYDRADLKSLLTYVLVHSVERAGRYDMRRPPYLNIWTHTWSNPGCRAESSLMFSVEFDADTASLTSVLLRPGYDWAIFLDELARLERAALGDTIYGKSRCEPHT